MHPLFLLLLFLFPGPDQEVCLSAEEQTLYDLIMDYRKSKDLPVVPLSKSLTYVAQLHALDLQQQQPDQHPCNMHSWSDAGDWTPCCYTPDHKQASCMWNKPKELTSYTGDGYEISAGGASSFSAYQMTAEKALSLWKSSPGHNGVITNQGIWKNANWQAIGIGIRGGYAMVWFGKVSDKTGEPVLCED
jgi:hypothetical protein